VTQPPFIHRHLVALIATFLVVLVAGAGGLAYTHLHDELRAQASKIQTYQQQQISSAKAEAKANAISTYYSRVQSAAYICSQIDTNTVGIRTVLEGAIADIGREPERIFKLAGVSKSAKVAEIRRDIAILPVPGACAKVTATYPVPPGAKPVGR
jgi:predicted metal-dependent phosphotriesterase family hydrolase